MFEGSYIEHSAILAKIKIEAVSVVKAQVNGMHTADSKYDRGKPIQINNS